MNKLQVITDGAGLAENRSKELISSYAALFKQAQEIVADAKSISVTEETQTKEMIEARKKRLELRNIRIDVEKTRVSLKEQALREGKAIDGLANVIKALVVPVEEYLQTQEDFIKIRKQKMIEELAEKRSAELSQYEVNPVEFDLGNMSDEAYSQLLNNSKFAYEARVALAKKQEEERIAAEKARIEEEKRLREENERLKKEAQIRDAQEKKAREAEEKRLAAEKKAREEAEEKLRVEKEKREAEIAKENARIAAEQKAKEEAERQKLLAPDKEKLLRLADDIDLVVIPVLKTKDAADIVMEVTETLAKLSDSIRTKAKTIR